MTSGPRSTANLRRRLIPAILLMLALAGFYAASLAFLDWQADRRYGQAAAEVDRGDPGWRLDDLLAGLDKPPDSANSAVALEAIAGRLPSAWPGDLLYDVSFFEVGRPEVRLDPARLGELRQVFERSSEFVAKARALAEMPTGQFRGPRPVVERLERVGGLNALRDAAFPYGEEVRRVAVLLWLDGMLSVEEGHFEAAMVDVRAMINAGRSIGDYPKLSAQQARQGASYLAISLLERILSQGEVREESLAAAGSLLADEARRPLALIALRGERAIVDDLLQEIRSGKADAGSIPQFDDHGWLDRGFTRRSTLRDNQADLLRSHTRMVEVGKLPEGDRVAAMKALNAEWSRAAASWGAMERSGKLAERLLFGRSVGVPLWFAGDQARLRVAIVALAAERHRLALGRWPESPEALVPAWLAAWPADPLGPGPIKLRRLPDGLSFYSNGYDGRDDGGQVREGQPMADGTDLGFRLRDLAHRRRPPSKNPPSEDRD